MHFLTVPVSASYAQRCPCPPRVGIKGIQVGTPGHLPSCRTRQHLRGEFGAELVDIKFSQSPEAGKQLDPPEAVETGGQARPEKKGRPWKTAWFCWFGLPKELEVSHFAYCSRAVGRTAKKRVTLYARLSSRGRFEQ